MFGKFIFVLFSGFFSFYSYSGTMGTVSRPSTPKFAMDLWSVNASLGYTSYNYGTDGTGQTPVGRFAIGRLLDETNRFSLGAELGVQNGNTLRLFMSQQQMEALGGLPVEATVTPMLDLLATLRVFSASSLPIFMDLKGGLAYRRMYVDRVTVDNKNQFAGEFQGGFGLPIADSSTLSILYQGIYGGSLGYTINTLSQTAYIKNIPIQNGILLSLNINL